MKLQVACDSISEGSTFVYAPGAESYQMSKTKFCDIELKEMKKMLFSASISPLFGWVGNADEHDFNLQFACSSDASKIFKQNK